MAEAIKLLQNNCTFLNEQLEISTGANQTLVEILRERGTDFPKDFCDLTEFTPGIISFALRFVNYTGYTGRISFDPFKLVRRSKKQKFLPGFSHFLTVKTFYLYNMQGLDYAPLVGNFSIFGSYINTSAVIFPNNNQKPNSGTKWLMFALLKRFL